VRHKNVTHLIYNFIKSLEIRLVKTSPQHNVHVGFILLIKTFFQNNISLHKTCYDIKGRIAHDFSSASKFVLGNISRVTVTDMLVM